MQIIFEELELGCTIHYFTTHAKLLAYLDELEQGIDEGHFLIFTDWKLREEVSQEQNLRLIKQHPIGAMSPLVVMSHYLTPQEHSLCYELGADYVFDKPNDYEYFLRLVKNILARYFE